MLSNLLVVALTSLVFSAVGCNEVNKPTKGTPKPSQLSNIIR